MEYTCDRCGYKTNNKQNIKNHLKRKNPCAPLLSDDNIEDLYEKYFGTQTQIAKELACHNCGKGFNSRSGLHYHTKICKTNASDIHLRELQETVHQLQNKLNKIESTNMFTTNTQNNTQNIFNIIATGSCKINDFGKETIDHITKTFLKSCLLRKEEGVKKLVAEVHLNCNVPENQNIRYKSIKHKTLEIFRNNRWIECNQSTTLDILINNGYRILSKHFIDNIDIDTDLILRQEHLTKWLAEIGTKSTNTYFDLRRDLCLLIKDSTMYALART